MTIKTKKKRKIASVEKLNVPKFNRDESPISWLFSRGYLTRRQFAAGEALRRDYELAQLDRMATMSWSPIGPSKGGGSGLNYSEAQIAAKSRFDGALDMAGRDMRDICWRIICAGEALPNAEKDMGWPARSGKLVLRLALDRVADYYKIAE
jgi:hypothetical protein